MSGNSACKLPDRSQHAIAEQVRASIGLKTRWFAIVAAILLFVTGGSDALALSPSFSGQRITIAVSTTTGGSYDYYARLASRHIGRFLNGAPTTIVANMPGAGGVIEANWLYNVAPKDGTAIAIIPLSAAFEPLLGSNQAKYDTRKFNWLASLNDYIGSAIVSAQAPHQVAQDIMQREVIIGGAGAGSDITIWPNLLKALIGAKIKLVTGYVGTSNVFLAMERGEVQGMIGQDWDGVKTSKGDWIRDGKVRTLLQIGMTRAPELKDVPTVLELAKDPDDRQVLEFFVSRQTYARPFAAPPGLAQELTTALREAFALMVLDREFLADAANARPPIVYAPGEHINALANRIYDSPPALIERAVQELDKANK